MKDAGLPGGTVRKYIFDIVGGLPVILMELNGSTVEKAYIYANGQIIAQHDGDCDAQRYFYLHDRLGSVRAVVEPDGDVNSCYFYDPWGLQEGTSENQEGVDNFYRFAGYMIDLEAGQYYCNARQYDYYIGRFTSRDPVRGSFTEPMTLHRYLYCLDDPANRIDPDGCMSLADTTAAQSESAGMRSSRTFDFFGLKLKVKNFTNFVSYRNKVLEQMARSGKNMHQWAKMTNQQVHHILAKGWRNVGRFGKDVIHSLENKIPLRGELHNPLHNFFNSGSRVHGFMRAGQLSRYSTLHKFVSTLSFQKQVVWWLTSLNYLLAKGTMHGFDPIAMGLPLK